jgi:hypothetical protein
MIDEPIDHGGGSHRVVGNQQRAVRKAHDEKATIIATAAPKSDSSEREFRAAAPDTASNTVAGYDNIRPVGLGTCDNIAGPGEDPPGRVSQLSSARFAHR